MRATTIALLFLGVSAGAFAQPSLGPPYADQVGDFAAPTKFILEQRPEEYIKLKELRNGDIQADGSDAGTDMKVVVRLKMVRSAAVGYGMKAGLAWRYGLTEQSLKAHQTQLSVIYDFSRLLMDEVVLPPVITVAKDERREYDDTTARSAKVVYRMEYPARVVTTPPQWQDFLIKGYTNSEKPEGTLLPKTDDEVKAWESGVDEGWKIGIHQAESIYRAQLALLTRAYKGMQTYHWLLEQGIVSRPILNRQDLGIVFEGQEVSIGNTVYELSGQPQFEGPRSWNPKERDDTPVSYPR